MTTEYKSMEYRVRRDDDGKWEWTVPELNIRGRAPDEGRAVVDAKTFIDRWFERLQ
jgi:hypothetical protein